MVTYFLSLSLSPSQSFFDHHYLNVYKISIANNKREREREREREGERKNKRMKGGECLVFEKKTSF